MIAHAPEAAVPRVPGIVAIVLAITAAWAVCIGAELTGAAHSLHHDALIEGGPPLWAALPLAVGAWLAMVAAMMLPTTLPLVRHYAVAVQHQPAPQRGVYLLVAGYTGVWTMMGAAAFLGDLGLHRAVDRSPWLHERPWLIAGGVLALAGAFQFSSLKERCLSICRHPAVYLMSHYRRGDSAALRLGVGHGLFCLGCCWALMLVMFAAGAASLAWMGVLALLMLYEKTGRHGIGVARLAGVALLILAALTLAHPEAMPALLGSSHH